jgi:hypothetical protein
MIKLNTPYHVAEENVTVTFTEVKNGTITGTYSTGTLTGGLEDNVLSATFHNSEVNAVGLIELTFNENGFNGKWKKGLEQGPMRGKWSGKLITDSNHSDSVSSTQINLDIHTGINEISKILQTLVNQSKEVKEDFCNQLIKFVRENQEFLWLIPAYLQELYSLECQIDDDELEGDISGFYNKSRFAEDMSTKIFSKQCMYFDSSNGLFAWNDEDDKTSVFNLILEDMDITLDDLIISYNSGYKSEEQTNFIKFVNILRTVLYASIVRAYYSEEYDNESIGYLISSPIEDENIRYIESKTSGFGDSLSWAVDDVLFCLNIDVNNEDYDEEWGNYSKNYEKMAEAISDQESYDTPLIEL